MYLLLTDETNLHSAEAVKFFIYGGLFFSSDVAPKLHEDILKIRKEAGYLPSDQLKFDTRERPKQVSIPAATEAKRNVVSACRENGCRFVAYASLHEIIKSRPREEQILFGLNSVLERFNRFLCNNGEYGIALSDTLPIESTNNYFKEKFSIGLKFADNHRPLKRILGYATTCSGASHFSSAIDIVLGSFRYAINHPKNMKAAAEMIANVTDLMWGFRVGIDAHVLETGLILRPKIDKILIPEYKQHYLDLIKSLSALDESGLDLRDEASKNSPETTSKPSPA